MQSWWDFGEGYGSLGNELILGLVECAFCGVRGQLKKIGSLQKSSKSSGKILHYDTVQCENCGNLMFVFWSASKFGGVHGLYAYKTLPFTLGEIEVPEHWNKDIKRFWLQAHKSLQAKNWDAAALMAGSALQVVIRDQGAIGNNLKQEIDDLHAKGILPQIMKDFANEVRELRNDSAHPTLGSKETSQKDSEDIVEFLDILLDYIYNLPKKINDYRGRKSGRTTP